MHLVHTSKFQPIGGKLKMFDVKNGYGNMFIKFLFFNCRCKLNYVFLSSSQISQYPSQTNLWAKLMVWNLVCSCLILSYCDSRINLYHFKFGHEMPSRLNKFQKNQIFFQKLFCVKVKNSTYIIKPY